MTFGLPTERDKFIISNLGLVKNRVLALNERIFNEDLFQVGILGLIEAVDKFDKSMGYEFSTYATYRIDGQIKDYKIYDSVIRPIRLKKGGYRYKEIVSLDKPIDDTDLCFGETLCSCNNLEDDVISRIHIDDFISKLSSKYQMVIRMWLDGMNPKNISQEGDINQAQVPIIVMRAKKRYLKYLADII